MKEQRRLANQTMHINQLLNGNKTSIISVDENHYLEINMNNQTMNIDELLDENETFRKLFNDNHFLEKKDIRKVVNYGNDLYQVFYFTGNYYRTSGDNEAGEILDSIILKPYIIEYEDHNEKPSHTKLLNKI
jgi:hypothetical protein